MLRSRNRAKTLFLPGIGCLLIIHQSVAMSLLGIITLSVVCEFHDKARLYEGVKAED